MNNEKSERRLRKRTRTPAVDHQSTQEEKNDQKSEQLAHVCESCGKVYSREYKLRQHERSEHRIEIVRQCRVCFLPHYCLPHHIIFTAKGQARHQCLVCFKVLTRCMANFEHQREVHGIDPFKGSVVHGDAGVPVTKGIQCKECLQLFKDHKTLNRHKTHTCPALSRNIAEILSIENRCEFCFWVTPTERRVCNCEARIKRETKTTAATTATTTTRATTTAATNSNTPSTSTL